MEKDKVRREQDETGNWWEGYPPERVLQVLIAPVIRQPADETDSDQPQIIAQAVRELVTYLEETFAGTPIIPLEAAGLVISRLTSPQCNVVIAQPFVANIASGKAEMEDIGTERPYR